MVIDCIKISSEIEEQLKNEIIYLKENKKIKPKLVIIRANDDLASEKYINNKVKKGKEIGVDVIVEKFDKKNNKDFIEIIKKYNNDKNTHGILVQLPIYKELDVNNIYKYISSSKDVDGLCFDTVGSFWLNSKNSIVAPCTARGVINVIDSVNYDLTGKNVVIINRSNIVGKPLINLLLSKNATVTICHSKTEKLSKITKKADVIITAVGKRNFINKSMVSKKAFVIDVGINVENKKVYGDANFDQLKNYVSYITPVPNGIGKLTVINVFKNLIDLIKQQVGE
ncbi:bifunctional 5,10-methylenetetrahydrofolate dehydrogenase/5,10-methenyltetrahydrofolate cyclohydrolase [Malacoplasma iowae]|uniref:Bifunctional protein FolD n=2 Tax=Malacoplasma iowae TaxID=2116 RepID=A0A084U3Z2_MALIO|nr:bifunctional 5,10-methylenetetrahydrofolate dehydrogenase/5,10-methenyltetrahydrofolate cyclohydrolase [Malacoplasma iowae]VEU61581.1 methylenetetrahydrofolate dehydrogenase [Mycoplasmopsis fermentans]EGZ31319.1 methylenetetrahydrofolate dehydrogenase [Malacoplasma iowae 695]KFB07678.1 5,10-methylene-tetrahydrofolate dehydrogenase / methenyl tetrahydrofolate cyclohydrolase [Malacoplasma iowae DK-CPA]QHG89326.1 bifunctional 5,10-methylenetetrahydrofolate dehydrogenase/5,10-methenyltetrahydrof